MTKARLLLAGLFVASVLAFGVSAQERSIATARGLATRSLGPTMHPPWPRDLSQIWLAPEGTGAVRSGNSSLAGAFGLMRGGEYSKLLALAAQPSAAQGPLGPYSTYYTGIAQLNLGRAADARKTFHALRQTKPVGYLAEAAAYGEADALVALNQPAEAADILDDVVRGKPMEMDTALLRLGNALRAAGQRSRAAETLVRVYYEFALSDAAVQAKSALEGLAQFEPLKANSERYRLEMGRAERLFAAHQYAASRAAFEDLDDVAAPGDRELIDLRIAESDYFLKRYRQARDGVRPYAANGVRKAEALYFFAVASREAGDTATFLQTSRRIADEFPLESWAEQALNDLGTYYIKSDNDDQADRVFREMIERFPDGAYGERASWKAGWRAYRDKNYRDAIKFFEQAATNYPRSDYRPSWLYWSARAHEALGETAEAESRHALVLADYQNSYYGRLTAKRLGARFAAVRDQVLAAQSGRADMSGPQPLPPNGPLVRALLAAGMYDEAQNELRYARRVWGDSPAIQATIAWANQQQSREESGMERLLLMRGAINTMRRAYPQILAAGGEDLPRDIQTVIFPIAYWDLIKKYTAARNIDPYLFAALVAQESTFVADVRSHANAYGLTQLLPSTARQYAKRLNIPYSSRVLTDPELNIRIGTAYLADKIAEFGGVHLALASYNAGERPVHRWMAEKPDLDREEFVDDMPYPETQGYVRKIIGTAEDYRRLYGELGTSDDGIDKTPTGADTSSVAPAKAPAAKAPAIKSPSKKKARPAPRVTPQPRGKAPAKKR